MRPPATVVLLAMLERDDPDALEALAAWLHARGAGNRQPGLLALLYTAARAGRAIPGKRLES